MRLCVLRVKWSRAMNGNLPNTNHGSDSHNNGWSWIDVFEIIGNLFEFAGLFF